MLTAAKGMRVLVDFSVLPTFKAHAKPKKMYFLFLPLQRNRELEVLCSFHSIAFETRGDALGCRARVLIIVGCDGIVIHYP
jgi:hypothetical protein